MNIIFTEIAVLVIGIILHNTRQIFVNLRVISRNDKNRVTVRTAVVCT